MQRGNTTRTSFHRQLPVREARRSREHGRTNLIALAESPIIASTNGVIETTVLAGEARSNHGRKNLVAGYGMHRSVLNIPCLHHSDDSYQ